MASRNSEQSNGWAHEFSRSQERMSSKVEKSHVVGYIDNAVSSSHEYTFHKYSMFIESDLLFLG